jgi:hypothetical protein
MCSDFRRTRSSICHICAPIDSPLSDSHSNFERLGAKLEKLYVHIGTHKTGSTSIQSFLRQHSDQFANDGILIPEAGTLDNTSGHHNIVYDLIGDDLLQKDRGNLRTLIEELRMSTCDSAIISSENFEWLLYNGKSLDHFNRAVTDNGYRPIYIFLFRERSIYMDSLYAELLKHGLKDSFSSFQQFIRDEGYFEFKKRWHFEFNYIRFVERWKEITSARVDVISYDFASKNGQLLPTFLSHVNASPHIKELSLHAPRLNTRPETCEEPIGAAW